MPRHSAEDLTICCIDDDLAEHHHWVGKQLGGAFDLRLPGGPLMVLRATTQPAVFETLEIVIGFGVTSIHLYAHMDCGGYPKLAGVNLNERGAEVEAATLRRDLDLASQILFMRGQQLQANLNITTAITQLVPQGSGFHAEFVSGSCASKSVPLEEYQTELALDLLPATCGNPAYA